MTATAALDDEYQYRIDAVTTRLDRAATGGPAALLVTPGADLAYLCGYWAPPLERLTCLVIRNDGPPTLLVPELESAAAQASPAAATGIQVVTWAEGESAPDLVTARINDCDSIFVDDHMWAYRVIDIQDRLPGVRVDPAGTVISELRLHKTPYEVGQLHAAGQAIDAVFAQVGEWLTPGRTEREIGAKIHEAMLEAGHGRVDFIIVASGPNSASPHHGVSDRQIRVGDAVVIDIGGAISTGYCSDSTRTFHLGNPTAEYSRAYEVLLAAQQAGVAAVRSGVPCEQIDSTCRSILATADLAQHFVHRTGHGIGLSTHEDPYLVAGNARPLEPGFAFSVEPGFYLPGGYGARIEDIVVCTDADPIVCNSRPHELAIIDV